MSLPRQIVRRLDNERAHLTRAFVRCVSIGAIVLILPLGDLTAQVILGDLLDHDGGNAVASAMVALLDSAGIERSRVRVTDQGRFTLQAPRPGSYRLQALRVGKLPMLSQPFTISADATLWITFRLGPEQDVARAGILDPITVTVERVPPQLREFFARRHDGHGIYLTAVDIEERFEPTIAEVVATLPGITLIWPSGPNSAGTTPWLRFSRAAGLCRRGHEQPAIFVDGFPFDAEMLRTVSPSDVGGIEIYNGPARMPPEFNRTGSACGAIVVWTK